MSELDMPSTVSCGRALTSPGRTPLNAPNSGIVASDEIRARTVDPVPEELTATGEQGELQLRASERGRRRDPA